LLSCAWGKAVLAACHLIVDLLTLVLMRTPYVFCQEASF
jgi:hypothetical protein